MMLKWINLNGTFLLKKSWNLTSVVYSALGFLAVWCSLEGLLPNNISIWRKISFSILIFIIIYILFFICTSIWYYYHNSICVIKKGNGKKVYVKYGDFIEEIKCSKERKNFIIPVNRCFDTIVDDRIISNNSIHGAFLKYLYSINLFSPEGLYSEIERELKDTECIELSPKNKPEGNRLRYPTGTIVDISDYSSNNHYYLLGLTTFDKNLTAHSSKEDFLLAIQRLIEYCNNHSQGYPVVLPLIGSGLARTNISKNDALRYLVRALEINKDIINCDFYIIVWNKDKENTVITNLK